MNFEITRSYADIPFTLCFEVTGPDEDLELTHVLHGTGENEFIFTDVIEDLLLKEMEADCAEFYSEIRHQVLNHYNED
jgi:hypothetical protein